MENIEFFAINLKQLMKTNGIGQLKLEEDLAKEGHVWKQSNISRFLNGSHKTISLENAIAISKLFNVSLGGLFGLEPLQLSAWMPNGDVFKNQIDQIYAQLSPEHREALAMHAQLLIKAQGTNIPAMVPYPVGPSDSTAIEPSSEHHHTKKLKL